MLEPKIKIRPELAKRLLSPEQAIELLETITEKGKKRVHTFEQSSFFVLGCNIDLTDIKKRIKKCEIGKILIADGMAGHGVAYFDEKQKNWLFLETNPTKLAEIKKRKKIN